MTSGLKSTSFPDSSLANVAENMFDAVILPGGMPGAANLDKSSLVTAVLDNAAKEGKIIAAICAAPFVLAKRGLLNGKTFTMYPGFDEYLDGAVPTGSPAEACGNIVTGKGPGAVFDFAFKLADSLGKDISSLYDGMFVKLS